MVGQNIKTLKKIILLNNFTSYKNIDPKIKIGNKKMIYFDSFDVNGSIMLTEECLLSKIQQRNIGVNREMYEKIFQNI